MKGQVLECKNWACQDSALLLLHPMMSKIRWKHFKYHDSYLWRWQPFSYKDQVLERHGKLETKQLYKNPLRGWSNVTLIQIPVRIRELYVKHTFHISLSTVVINMAFTRLSDRNTKEMSFLTFQSYCFLLSVKILNLGNQDWLLWKYWWYRHTDDRNKPLFMMYLLFTVS